MVCECGHLGTPTAGADFDRLPLYLRIQKAKSRIYRINPLPPITLTALTSNLPGRDTKQPREAYTVTPDRRPQTVCPVIVGELVIFCSR